MADRDFVAELHALEQQVADAQRQQGRLQSDKAALSRHKAEIVTTCAELGVAPKRELIEAEIEATAAKLGAELKAIDTELRAMA